MNEVEHSEVYFSLHSTNARDALSLRNILFDEIPILGITSVIILENNSHILNEVLATRLGAIPINTSDFLKYRGMDKFVASLEVKGPGFIYSGNIVYGDKEEPIAVYQNIPIVRLYPGEKISCVLYVRVVTGTVSAQYTTVASVTYKKNDLGTAFLFVVETVGGLTGEEIIDKAKEVYKKLHGYYPDIEISG